MNAGVVASNISNLAMNSNLIANCGSTITSTGSFFGIYNNGSSAGNLSMSNNTFTNNTSVIAGGASYMLHNRGTLSNTFTAIAINNNLVAGQTNSATGAGTFYKIFNNTVSSGSLGITGNTFVTVSWASSTATRYLIANTGTVGAGGISISGNLFSDLSNTVNTTGGFFGINTTGSCTSVLDVSTNTFTNIRSSASSGIINLLSNTGAISTSVGITNNLFSGISNTTTTSGDASFIANTGSSTSTVNISSNTFTNNTVNTSTGNTYLINNARGCGPTTINLINLSNNLVTGCSNVINGAGAFFGIYNNGVSAASLLMNNNTFTNCASTASNGATQLIYNRGALTNTFVTLSVANNLVSTYTNVSVANGSFFPVYNNGVTTGNTGITSNTVVSVVWTTTASTKNLIYKQRRIHRGDRHYKQPYFQLHQHCQFNRQLLRDQ